MNLFWRNNHHDGSTVNRPNNAQEIYLKELGSESPMLVRLNIVGQGKDNLCGF